MAAIVEPPEMHTLERSLAKLESERNSARLQGHLAHVSVQKLHRQVADVMVEVEKSLNLIKDPAINYYYYDDKRDIYYRDIYKWFGGSNFINWESRNELPLPEESDAPSEVKGGLSLQEQEKILSERLMVEFSNWQKTSAKLDDYGKQILTVKEEISKLKGAMFDSLNKVRAKYPWYVVR